ncbi:DUF4307 domain-containing protein [Actinobacteria bacterium YIM 96077]|uniref:DUF4307 domain-containing protein n=1 Tax=Phytoactinopolyspora halophila TaxID=1981511 RepID=A0A329QHS1_9ACTN|nr:DUF4307 domain-containing protein [Phytoactinopolyspora halophila]AYY14362.1 DUF4307 domain-containing protein [Actinobacteria bacterium YIM 96077]RAW11915.1 hypothetical protein DPM12_15775 [Phytoactinopolyspora halophila]
MTHDDSTFQHRPAAQSDADAGHDWLRDRYGHQDDGRTHSNGRGARRRTQLILAATGALLAVAVSWFIVDLQSDGYQAELHSWNDPVDDRMPVTVEVDRPPGTALECELVVVDRRFVVVGQLTLEIPASDDRQQRVDAEIPLRGDGIAPKVEECSVPE